MVKQNKITALDIPETEVSLMYPSQYGIYRAEFGSGPKHGFRIIVVHV
jgi:hypothetical protein